MRIARSDRGTGIQITLICSSAIVAATRRDLRQNGGYRSSSPGLVADTRLL
jgi:hypothetical protein